MIIIGCGYVGRAVARYYVKRGQSVVGIVRSDDSAAAVEATGARVVQLDLTRDPLDALTGFGLRGERVFHFAPPPGDGDGDPLTARLVEVFDREGPPKRLVYIGTTGVYGDCGGAWVNEDRPPRPVASRARRRWDAEQRLRAWSDASGADLVILRVAGIYACDRLPLERIRSGQPVVRADEAPWTNRIHAQDLLAVCIAAMERAPAGGLYNVSDGHPSTMTDYFHRVADAAGLSRPDEIPLAEAPGKVSPGMLSYLAESRRLDNRRMLSELGLTLRYPELAVGLADCNLGG